MTSHSVTIKNVEVVVSIDCVCQCVSLGVVQFSSLLLPLT